MRKKSKSAKIDQSIILNVSASDRQLLESTAALFEMDLSSYLREVLVRHTKELRKQSQIRLSRRDLTAFMKACSTPAMPNRALRAAFRDYQKRFRRQEF